LKAYRALAGIGLGLAGLSALGLAVVYFAPGLRKRLAPRAAVVGTCVLAVLGSHLALLYANEPRHLLHAFPLALGLAFAGARWTVDWFVNSRWAPAAAAAVCALAGGVAISRVPNHEAFRAAADAIRVDQALGEAVIMVSSQAGGEAIFVAEMAALEPRPKRVVLRATKILADAGWMARRYELRYRSGEEVAAYLDRIPVGVVAFDETAGDARLTHHNLVAEALALHPERWQRIELSGPLRLYRAAREDLRQRTPIRVDLTRRIGNALELRPPPGRDAGEAPN
jgi:hypothetical protein